MYVYEIEYQYSQFVYTETVYIISPTLDRVTDWVNNHPEYNITHIGKLGKCEIILSDE